MEAGEGVEEEGAEVEVGQVLHLLKQVQVGVGQVLDGVFWVVHLVQVLWLAPLKVEGV